MWQALYLAASIKYINYVCHYVIPLLSPLDFKDLVKYTLSSKIIAPKHTSAFITIWHNKDTVIAETPSYTHVGTWKSVLSPSSYINIVA